MGGSAVKTVVNTGMEAHVDQKRVRKHAKKNPDNLSLRASLEKKLGMRDDLPEKKKERDPPPRQAYRQPDHLGRARCDDQQGCRHAQNAK